MSTQSPAYRDFTYSARLRYADLCALSLGATRRSDARTVAAARSARIHAGVTGIAGAVLLAASAVADAVLRVHVPLSAVLALSWPAMGVAYLVGRWRGERRVDALAVPVQTGDIAADLARLEAREPVAAARRHAEHLEQAATALPMIAVALLAPLTIHLPFAAKVGLDQFDRWIMLSLAIVGHAHLALAYMYARFARRAKEHSSYVLELSRSHFEWTAWVTALGVSAVPGIFFVLLPPVLTGLTGLLFNPILFRRMTRTILDERAALAQDHA